MDNGLSKQRHHDRLSPGSFDSPCCVAAIFLSFRNPARPPLVSLCGNRDEGITGNVPPIVHTASAFNPSAQEAARQETA
jgi:hypothetical protein